jgi:hypothetical protein
MVGRLGGSAARRLEKEPAILLALLALLALQKGMP